jgi:aspartate 1-decarboxylase
MRFATYSVPKRPVAGTIVVVGAAERLASSTMMVVIASVMLGFTKRMRMICVCP